MTAMRVLRLAHFGGLVLFLGSIFSFIVVSSLTKEASLADLVFGRKIISAGTNYLTLPGMWLLAITGVWMGLRKYGTSSHFFQAKLLLIALIVVNAHFFIVPAVENATGIAKQSLAAGRIAAGYHDAFLREEISGALNVLLAVVAAIVGVWRIGGKAAS